MRGFEEYEQPTQIIYMPINEATEEMPVLTEADLELPVIDLSRSGELFASDTPAKLGQVPKQTEKLHWWRAKFFAPLLVVVFLWLAFMGGGMVGRATAPAPTYQMLTQDATIPGLLHAAGTGKNVHFVGRVVNDDTSTGFDFALLADQASRADTIVVLIPIQDAMTLKVGQVVQVWGYVYGEYITGTGIETLVIAQEVK